MSFSQISPAISPRLTPSGSPSRINVVQPLQSSPKLAYVSKDDDVKHGPETYTLSKFDGSWKKALNITFIGAFFV